MDESLLITIVVVVILVILFGYYRFKIYQIQKADKELRKVLSSNEILASLMRMRFEHIMARDYDLSRCLILDSGEKKDN